MGDVIKISRENLSLCESALGELREHLAELIGMTLEYPVEVGFAGYRFVFTSEDEINQLIAALDTKITTFKRVA